MNWIQNVLLLYRVHRLREIIICEVKVMQHRQIYRDFLLEYVPRVSYQAEVLGLRGHHLSEDYAVGLFGGVLL